MRFLLNEEQIMIQQMAKNFLAKKSPFAQMNENHFRLSNMCRFNWIEASENMGWQATIITEEHDGLALGMVELALIFEKIGEKMWFSPMFSTVGITTPLCQFSNSTELLAKYLPDIAAGNKIGTCPLPWQLNDPAQSYVDLVKVWCSTTDDGVILQGHYSHVLDAGNADFIVLPVRDQETQLLRIFIVDLPYSGIKITSQNMLDKTLDMYKVDVSGVTLNLAQELLFPDTEQAYIATIELATVTQSAQMLGGMSALLDMTLDYCQNRRQFGQPISNFQVTKHKAADILLQVESAKTAVYAAACRAQEFIQGDSSLVSLQQTVSVAQAYLSEAFFSVASEAIQMHGAVGITWEYQVHWYFKRAKSFANMLGDSAFHRERLVQLTLAQK